MIKTFIIYNKVNQYSVKIAKECLKSFSRFKNWNARLFNGCSPMVLPAYERKYRISNNRSYPKPNKPSYKTKKSCFYSHFELWNKCVNFKHPIVIIEHDAECLMDFDNNWVIKNGALQLTTEYMIGLNKIELPTKFPDEYATFVENGNGIHPITYWSQKTGYPRMIGGVGYLITPQACGVLINNCKKLGWRANDDLITTQLIPLFYLHPAPIKYCVEKELDSSVRWKQ